MNKNKILLFIKTPPPVTGVTLMCTRVRDSKLLNDSFQFDSINLSYAKDFSDMGSFRPAKFYLVFKYCARLIQYLYSKDYSFVYFQLSHYGNGFYRDLLYITIIKLFRKKIVYHLRGKNIKKRAQNFINKFFYKFIFKKEYVIMLSNLLKYDTEDVYEGKIFIVPNGIPDIKYIQKKMTKDGATLRILFFSNLLYSKGIIDFINTIEILIAKKINMQAFIVGNEGEITRKELNKLIIKKNLENYLEYLGPKYGEDKNKIFQNIDLLIYPTLEDIWGNVNVEAMQNCIPIIATKEGAIPEIIDDGITGFLVDKNSPDQIAEKVEILYNNRELLQQMGVAGRKKYEEKYRLEIFEQNMKSVFEEVLGEIKGRTSV